MIRLEQDRIRYTDLADVVEQASPVDFPQRGRIGIVMPSQDQGMGCDTLGVQARFVFAQVEGGGDGFREFLIRVFVDKPGQFLARIEQAVLAGQVLLCRMVLSVAGPAAADMAFGTCPRTRLLAWSTTSCIECHVAVRYEG